MTIVMDMTSYEIDPDASMSSEYDDEIESTGWNPAVALVPLESVLPENHSTLPAGLAEVDAEQFLQKMYTLLS